MTDPWSPPAEQKRRLPHPGSAAWEELKDRLDEAAAVHCHECSYRGPTLRKHYSFQWYHFVLMPLIMLLGAGIFGIVVLVAWAGSTRAACAACGSTNQIEPFDGAISDQARGRWEQAALRDGRRHRRNGLITLGIVLSMFVAVLVLFSR